MFEAAIYGASQLSLAPSPSNRPRGFNRPDDMQARAPMLRALLKAERWDDILDADLLAWPERPSRMAARMRAYAEAMSYLALGDPDSAELLWADFESSDASGQYVYQEEDDEEAEGEEEPDGPQELELQGLIALARGDRSGLKTLRDAAERQEEIWHNDPPRDAYFIFNLVGEAHLFFGEPERAQEAFERTLETVIHDGVALAGLVQAYHAQGKDELAAEALAALEVLWGDADAGNRHLQAARATGVTPATGELSPRFRQRVNQRRMRMT